MPYQYRKDMDHSILSNIPISELKLSQRTVEILSDRGIATVEDCTWFYINASSAMIRASGEFLGAMEYEVLPSLIEHGYWLYLEEVD